MLNTAAIHASLAAIFAASAQSRWRRTRTRTPAPARRVSRVPGVFRGIVRGNAGRVGKREREREEQEQEQQQRSRFQL